jgi:hypothetical protein
VTPQEWAEVFRAGWDASGIVKHEPAGDAMAKALHAMELKCEEISARSES